jgi:Domain of unknown function (DUF397)
MATASDHPGWRTSSFTDNGQSCVEVAPGPRVVRVRDTKDGGLGPILLLDHDAWAEFRAAAVARRCGSAGGVVIVHEPRRTRHRGVEVATVWHVSCGDRTLHYTDAEWVAFAAGVRAGEFGFTPAR